MADFTIKTYISIIEALSKQGFSFQSFMEFITAPTGKVIVLRHDVDLLPGNSMKFAKIEARKGLKGTYYFRIVPESFDEKIIKEIFSLGHEVGYHYEDVTRCTVSGLRHAAGRRLPIAGSQSQNSSLDEEEVIAKLAIESFKENLRKLRAIAPVQTICMHGSPMSRWDSRLLWKYYDYHDFGIIGEPYFDINFDEVLYLTDTGRRWDGDSYNIRDKAAGDRRKAEGSRLKHTLQPSALSPQPSPQFPRFHSTFDIIHAAETGLLPDKIMITFHPQRWTDKPIPWMKELVWQNVKNVGKYFVVKLRQ